MPFFDHISKMDLMFYGSIAGGVCGIISVLLLFALSAKMSGEFLELKLKLAEKARETK